MGNLANISQVASVKAQIGIHGFNSSRVLGKEFCNISLPWLKFHEAKGLTEDTVPTNHFYKSDMDRQQAHFPLAKTPQKVPNVLAPIFGSFST